MFICTGTGILCAQIWLQASDEYRSHRHATVFLIHRNLGVVTLSPLKDGLRYNGFLGTVRGWVVGIILVPCLLINIGGYPLECKVAVSFSFLSSIFVAAAMFSRALVCIAGENGRQNLGIALPTLYAVHLS